MKILHVVTLSELGGSQSIIVNLATESIADGHEVMVAASAGGDLWHILPDQVLQWPIQTLQRNISPLNDLRTYLELKRIFREFSPDVVHLHSSKIGFLGRLAFPSHKIIYTVHGFDSVRVAYRRFLFFEKVLQHRARYIVTVSKYDRDNLLTEGISKNVVCIYNGVSDYKTQAKIAPPPLATLSKIDGHFTVICIARLAPPKNFALFCEIAQSLNGQRVEFYWVGNKEQPTNLPENVHCLGEFPNAHLLIPEADLFLLPTEYEGMPVSILESLCYGVPALASDVGGISEILDGNNGFALKNRVEEFRGAILSYVHSFDTYKKARANARKSYLRSFTTSQMYEAYLALYESVARTRP